MNNQKLACMFPMCILHLPVCENNAFICVWMNIVVPFDAIKVFFFGKFIIVDVECLEKIICFNLTSGTYDP